MAKRKLNKTNKTESNETKESKKTEESKETVNTEEVHYPDEDARGWYWQFLVYDESVSKDWVESLEERGLECAYIKHDRFLESEKYTKEGKIKKVHTHVVIQFSNSTTFKVVKEITDSINAKPPRAVRNIRGAVRYLMHMDSNKKYQFDREEVNTINGFDVDKYINMKTESQERDLYLKIRTLCKEMDFFNYADLEDYLEENQMWDEFFYIVEKGGNQISRYLNGRFQRHGLEYKVIKMEKEETDQSLFDVMAQRTRQKNMEEKQIQAMTERYEKVLMKLEEQEESNTNKEE